MKKFLPIVSVAIFFVGISFLGPLPAFGQENCQISSPDSANYNQLVEVSVSGVPSPSSSGVTPALAVLDATGTELACFPVGFPSARGLKVGLPGSGQWALLQVQMRRGEGLVGNCGSFVSAPGCQKYITLEGSPLGSSTCGVSVDQQGSKVVVKADNLPCTEEGYCFSVVNPNGFEESKQCKRWGGVCNGSMEASFNIQANWQQGNFTAQVRKIAPTQGDLVSSCNFLRGIPQKWPVKCEGGAGVQTALGCIPVKDTNAFIAWFLGWAIGIAGGIAFLLIVAAGFMVMTAAGNPERAQAGRELLTAAISGLIIIIFSAFLLKLIGVDILKIPGFGKTN